ncbi:CHAT domain protein [Ceratobasidium sp. AG-Ba]|nr:CHAT domain protein [Ceratobasidium sp. AG-Ba]
MGSTLCCIRNGDKTDKLGNQDERTTEATPLLSEIPQVESENHPGPSDVLDNARGNLLEVPCNRVAGPSTSPNLSTQGASKSSEGLEAADVAELNRLVGELEQGAPATSLQETRIDEAISLLEKMVARLPEDTHGFKAEKLAILGTSYRDRFNRTGRIEYLDKAIDYRRHAILLTPEEPIKSGTLARLSALYHVRFLKLRNPADIDSAVEYMGLSVSLTPTGDEEISQRLTRLGGLHIDRFVRVGELIDAQKAIEYHCEALSIIPEGHLERPQKLGSISDAYHTRFLYLGDPGDLDKAIKYREQAVLLTPDQDHEKARRLGALGVLYWNRFNSFGELPDIELAISYKSQSLSLTQDEHPDKPSRLNNLGNSHLARFRRLGELKDLDMAITYQTQAVSATQANHPLTPSRLSNLGSSLLTRFEHQGELGDLNKAIEFQTQATQMIPEDHKDKVAMLNNLGYSYEIRFQHSGDPADVDKAIELKSQAVAHLPEDHTDRPPWLSNLGNSYLSRYNRLGELDDLDKAIECHRQAENLTDIGHAEKSIRINCLGNSYLSRFEALGNLPDIDTAIGCLDQAVGMIPIDHTSRPAWLSHLGVSYLRRFEELSKQSDIDLAVNKMTEAVLSATDEHIGKPMLFNNLGIAYFSRFKYFGQIGDIDKAIEYQSHAVAFCAQGNTFLARWLNNLGFSFRQRFELTGDARDQDRCIESYEAAAHAQAGHPLATLEASLNWARSLVQYNRPAPLEAYNHAMSLIPKVAWLGVSVGRRYETIKTAIEGVALEAAAFAIGHGSFDRALSWLEQGRFIVWSQLLQLRAPLERLCECSPQLANELQWVAHELDSSPSARSWDIKLAPDESPEENSRYYRSLVQRWESLVSQVQLLPGFENFLHPQKEIIPSDVTQNGAVVIVNIHPSRCDALALLPGHNAIKHISLADYSYTKVNHSRAQLISCLNDSSHMQRTKTTLHNDYIAARGKPGITEQWALEMEKSLSHTARGPLFFPKQDTGSFSEVLHELWVDIVKPILEAIGYLKRNNPHDCDTLELPHVTWCTTGALSFLPLHAAGSYGDSGSHVFDHVVSSYTPALSTLAKYSLRADGFCGILTVGQASTLPETVAELDQIQKLAHDLRCTRLEGPDATPGAVLLEMGKHSWVHFACHAIQSAQDPTKSAFHLHGGELDLTSITSKPLKYADLAFLSACETAAGDESLPEEVVHLAAGMIVAGYSTVIATMWSVQDNDAPFIAKEVYSRLFKGGTPNSRKAFLALHCAVASLREKVGEQNFARWVPFIHIGC